MRQDLIIGIAGAGGDGVISAGESLITAAALEGYHAIMTKSFGSQIRGGEASCRLRLATQTGSPTPEKCCGRNGGLVCPDRDIGPVACGVDAHRGNDLAQSARAFDNAVRTFRQVTSAGHRAPCTAPPSLRLGASQLASAMCYSRRRWLGFAGAEPRMPLPVKLTLSKDKAALAMQLRRWAELPSLTPHPCLTWFGHR